MELRMQSRRFDLSRPDWLVGAIAGFVAGAVLMVMELLWSITSLDGSPWVMSHQIAAIAMGPGVLHSIGQFDVGIVTVALVIHYALGIFTGLVIAALVAALRIEDSPGTVMVVGLVLGAIIYFVNFYLFSSIFPWFTELRGSGTMVAHMIFGVVAAGIYWQLGRVVER